jgi:hypothetical protein
MNTIGDNIQSVGRRNSVQQLPYAVISADCASGPESKVINMAGHLRAGIINMGIIMQTVGCSVTPYFSLYPASEAELKDPLNSMPWAPASGAAVAANTLYNFGNLYGFWLRLDFAQKGTVIVSSL